MDDDLLDAVLVTSGERRAASPIVAETERVGARLVAWRELPELRGPHPHAATSPDGRGWFRTSDLSRVKRIQLMVDIAENQAFPGDLAKADDGG